MTFRVGQKVVCVAREGWDDLTVGAIYIISIVQAKNVSVEGVRHPQLFFGCAQFEKHKFRPLVERKTDIAIFKRMLAPKRQRKTVVA